MDRKIPVKTHKQMVDEWKRDPRFRKAYDDLDTEYGLLRSLLSARKKAGMTQADVAKKMGVQPPAVTRLETALSQRRHSPTVFTLKRYAHAVGRRLKINLVAAPKKTGA